MKHTKTELANKIKMSENNTLTATVNEDCAGAGRKMQLSTMFCYDRDKTLKLDRIASVYQNVTSDTDGRTHKETVNVYLRNTEQTDISKATDLCKAVIDEKAPLLTYITVKTAYARSGHKMLYDLLTDIVRRTPNYKSEAFAQWLAMDDNVTGYLPKSADIEKELESAQGQKMQRVIVHKKRLVTFPDGTKHFIETLPTYEAVNTSFGRLTFNDTEDNSSLDAEDLISTAKVALYELFAIGLLKSVNDIWTYRKYVYSRVNAVVHGEKAYEGHNRPLYMTVGTGETAEDRPAYTEKTVAQVDKMLLHIERGAVIEKLYEILENNMDSRTNREGVLYAFDAVYIEGQTLTEVADKWSVSVKTVNKWLSHAKKYLTETAHVRENVYDMLTACMVG